ncbi:MAG: pantoate--beta-alanine ligase [Acidobacteriota bacterium]|jgi:pantoate--beta-alanine ligase|nr:pantoate--beta-alanine ligase [Acidobacteriota bacterium]
MKPRRLAAAKYDSPFTIYHLPNMEIINRRQRMASVARKLRREEDKTIGLVPTMGALHDGHLSLVREARRMCDVVIVSVFVNPAQFGPGEDFSRYPRDLTGDTTKLADYNVDYIFAPPAEEIYPKGFATYVGVEGLSETMEGVARPGHFRGVATVLTILFNAIRPDFAFFGQKDAQQTLVVKRLVRDLAFDIEVVVLPTVREQSGLALSSRNAYLSDEQHRAAAALYRSLAQAREVYLEGERNPRRLAEVVRSQLDAEPLARLEYVGVVDAETMEKFDRIPEDRPVLIALAASVGRTRLIDNIVIQPARQKARTTSES